MVSEPCRLCFIASCTRMEEGGVEYPLLLASRSVELRRGEHCRTVLGKPSPRPPRVCGVVGTLCRGHTERQ
ncbi:hypothetical protein HAX54_009168, partial [Datura stramonium]|nr:hypothetical protein [Datura stramonium]